MTNEQLLDEAIKTAEQAIKFAEDFAARCDAKDAEIKRLTTVIAERDQTIEDMALGTCRDTPQ